jgi:predicted SAM-dependent methyltransferase
MRQALLFLFSHRLLAIARWDGHFLLLRLKNLLFGENRRLRRLAASKGSPVYLNLGSGPRGRDDPRWINVDGYRDSNVHFLLDINRSLPIDDCSLDGVFCEHVLEYFSLADGERIATDIRRCLKPGGIFRIIVPDAERIMREYFESPARLAERRDSETAIEAVNSYFRQRYDNQFLYDWLAMKAMLERAGFQVVSRTYFRKSKNSDLVLDHPKYEWESLYVEAVR